MDPILNHLAGVTDLRHQFICAALALCGALRKPGPKHFSGLERRSDWIPRQIIRTRGRRSGQFGHCRFVRCTNRSRVYQPGAFGRILVGRNRLSYNPGAQTLGDNIGTGGATRGEHREDDQPSLHRYVLLGRPRCSPRFSLAVAHDNTCSSPLGPLVENNEQH